MVVSIQPRHPVDTGYSWMVCLGGFLLNFFVNGSLRSMGILFVEITELYQAKASISAAIMSFNMCGYAIFAAVGNAIGAMSTMRLPCLIGSVLLFIGVFATAAANNIYVVVFFLGAVCGMSYGFMQPTSMVAVAQFFDRRRALALGIAAAGGSVGTLVFPLFLRFIIDRYGFRGGMILYAAVVLHAIPASMLLRPPSFYTPKNVNKTTQTYKTLRNATYTNPVDDANDDGEEIQTSSFNDVDCDQQTSFAAGTSTSVTLSRRSSTSSLSSCGSTSELVHADDGQPASRNGQMQRRQISSSTPSWSSPPGGGGGLSKFRSKLFDRYLIHSWAFLCFTITLLFGQISLFDACWFLPPFAVEKWNNKAIASGLITVVGVSDFVGRIGGGWFADGHWVKVAYQVTASFLIAGPATILSPLLNSVPIMFVYAVVLGVFGGAFQGLIATLLAEQFGLERLPAALGLSHLVLGLIGFPFPPLIGKVKEATGSYADGMYITGVLQILAGIASCLIPTMDRIDRRRPVVHEDLGDDGRGTHELLSQSTAA